LKISDIKNKKITYYNYKNCLKILKLSERMDNVIVDFWEVAVYGIL